MQRFSSTDQYIATDELIEAVNASITLEKPLLIKGEPGTGKTKLAEEIALKFDTKLINGISNPQQKLIKDFMNMTLFQD